MKTAITGILGLVLQLSLVMPGLTAVITDPAPVAESCECCAGLDSCPCAKEGEPVQKPLPLAPGANQTAKVPLAKGAGTRVFLETIFSRPPAATRVAATPVTDPWTGYTGVRLSVAYCSFVI